MAARRISAREPYSTRRTVYGFIDRNNVNEVMFNFDFANPDLTTGKRHQTTVPQQALFLMNSPLVVEQAKALVERKDFTGLTDDRSRIVLLYEMIYQRLPRPEEVQLGLDFIATQPAQERVAAPGNRRPAQGRLREQAQAKMQQRRGRGVSLPLTRSRSPPGKNTRTRFFRPTRQVSSIDLTACGSRSNEVRFPDWRVAARCVRNYHRTKSAVVRSI
jgi:hypothetical protein